MLFSLTGGAALAEEAPPLPNFRGTPPPPASAPQFNYNYPNSPWSGRGPGMGSYGFNNTPGMGGMGMGNLGMMGMAPGQNLGQGFYGYPPMPPAATPPAGRGYGWSGAQPAPPVMNTDPAYYNYGPGVMMGQGMMQFGLGPGMIRGVGVMGYVSTETFQKFFDETRDMRKELNGLMFDYAELLRRPSVNQEERVKLENRIMSLRQKVYDKAPRYQFPFD
jgi:hypothetical protein